MGDWLDSYTSNVLSIVVFPKRFIKIKRVTQWLEKMTTMSLRQWTQLGFYNLRYIDPVPI